MRLIDADELIRRVNENEFYTDKLKIVLCSIVDTAPTITASPWHRVDEPPKKDGKYLVCWKDGGGFCYDTAWWTSVGTWSLSHWTGVTVTHWMPIEPPKEGQNDNNKM